MIFAYGAAGAPPSQDFTVTQDWQKFTLDMEKFAGFTPGSFVGFAIAAGPETGMFGYDIDAVTLGK